MVRRIRLALLLALLGLASAQAAELTATVDRKEVALQEHVVLTLSLINSDTRLRAQGISPNVDLSVLTKDFDVGTPKVKNNYNIFRGRGRSTSKLSVDLFPRRTGKLLIPAFTVDGLHTAPIAIQARGLPPGTMPEVFSRGGANKATIWQREQVVAWLDVYHRVQLKSASIGEYLSTEPTAIELLEHQDLPQGERKETVKGVEYGVTRIAWAIFPKQAGTITVYLPDVWLVTADDRKLRLPHQKQQIEVRPLPAAVSDNIAVGKPELALTDPSPAPAVNNLSTWTVTVRGPFSRFALPDTLPLPPLPDGIKVYSDHGQRDAAPLTGGLTTVVSYTLSALPQHGGDFTLPPLRIPYFDTERGALDVAELPGAQLKVPAAAAVATPTAAAIPQATAPTVETGTGAAPATPWRTAALALAVLWMMTLVILRRRPRPAPVSDRPETPRPAPPPPAAHHPLQARLLAAFDSRTLQQGLNAWEARHGVDPRVRDTVRAVQQLVYGQGRNAAQEGLSAAVDEAVALIRNTAPPAVPAAHDPWRPEAFVANPGKQ